MANILVTGGTGQIGTYVCSELVGQGHKVVAMDSRPGNTGASELILGDVTDLDELLTVIKSREITHVIHLAALLVLDSKEHPSRAVRVNCVGTDMVFEAARLMDLERVVFASSVAVYGPRVYFPKSLATEEDYPHCPPDPYSITKLTNELMSEFYRRSYGLDILCLRLTGAWGPGRYSGYTGQFNDFIKKAALGKAAQLPEDFAYKDAKFRWLYVKEMAACISFAALVDKKKVKRGLYNVGTKKPYKALDIIGALRISLKEPDNISYKETSEPTQLSSDIAGPSGLDVDCSKLYDELGYDQRMGLAESVSDMIAFERAHK
jgi:nucleoside-diphosphate-sugar epimerase